MAYNKFSVLLLFSDMLDMDKLLVGLVASILRQRALQRWTVVAWV